MIVLVRIITKEFFFNTLVWSNSACLFLLSLFKT